MQMKNKKFDINIQYAGAPYKDMYFSVYAKDKADAVKRAMDFVRYRYDQGNVFAMGFCSMSINCFDEDDDIEEK